MTALLQEVRQYPNVASLQAAPAEAAVPSLLIPCALVLGRRGHAPVQAHTGLLHGFASPARSDRAGSAPGQGG
jgi:hypothetical protein